MSQTPLVMQVNLDYLIGRLLTQVDATFSDPAQRKAQKDLVNQVVRDWYLDLPLADGTTLRSKRYTPEA